MFSLVKNLLKNSSTETGTINVTNREKAMYDSTETRTINVTNREKPMYDSQIPKIIYFLIASRDTHSSYCSEQLIDSYMKYEIKGDKINWYDAPSNAIIAICAMNAMMLYYIPRNKISCDVILASVTNDSLVSYEFMCPRFMTAKLNKIAVLSNPKTFKYIGSFSNVKNEIIKLIASTYGIKTLVKYLSYCGDYDMIVSAIMSDVNYLRYVHKNNKNYEKLVEIALYDTFNFNVYNNEICDLETRAQALEKHFGVDKMIIDEIRNKNTNYEPSMTNIKVKHVKEPVKATYNDLLYDQSVGRCLHRVKRDHRALGLIINQTDEIIETAVVNDYRSLIYVIDLNEKIALNSVKFDFRALVFVKHTPAVCMEAIKNDIRSLMLIKQTSMLCNMAVRLDYRALLYVKNIDNEIIMNACENNIRALRFAELIKC